MITHESSLYSFVPNAITVIRKQFPEEFEQEEQVSELMEVLVESLDKTVLSRRSSSIDEGLVAFEIGRGKGIAKPSAGICFVGHLSHELGHGLLTWELDVSFVGVHHKAKDKMTLLSFQGLREWILTGDMAKERMALNVMKKVKVPLFLSKGFRMRSLLFREEFSSVHIEESKTRSRTRSPLRFVFSTPFGPVVSPWMGVQDMILMRQSMELEKEPSIYALKKFAGIDWHGDIRDPELGKKILKHQLTVKSFGDLEP